MSENESIGTGGNLAIMSDDGVPPGSIVLSVGDGSEVLRFEHDGKAYVRGELVDENREIYMHFRRWLQLACGTLGD